MQLRHRQDMQSSTGNAAFADAGTTSWGIEDDDDDDPPLLAQASVGDLKAQNRMALEGEKDLAVPKDSFNHIVLDYSHIWSIDEACSCPDTVSKTFSSLFNKPKSS